MFTSTERVERDGRLVAFEGETMTDEEAAARGLAPAPSKEPEATEPKEMTVKQLKSLLESNGVEYPAGAKKAELLALAENPPEEDDLYDDEEE